MIPRDGENSSEISSAHIDVNCGNSFFLTEDLTSDKWNPRHNTLAVPQNCKLTKIYTLE